MADDFTDEQRDFVADLIAGRVCEVCGDTIEPGTPCDACAEKRELLRQGIPRLHGDA